MSPFPDPRIVPPVNTWSLQPISSTGPPGPRSRVSHSSRSRSMVSNTSVHSRRLASPSVGRAPQDRSFSTLSEAVLRTSVIPTAPCAPPGALRSPLQQPSDALRSQLQQALPQFPDLSRYSGDLFPVAPTSTMPRLQQPPVPNITMPLIDLTSQSYQVQPQPLPFFVPTQVAPPVIPQPAMDRDASLRQLATLLLDSITRPCTLPAPAAQATIIDFG